MSQSVRAITVAPQFFMTRPRARRAPAPRHTMERQPADLWMIIVGPPGSAARVMDSLFVFGPAEPVEIDGPELGVSPPDAR